MTKFILFILAIGMVSCSVKEVTRNKLEIPPTIDMSTPVEVKSAPAPASKVYIDNKTKEVIVITPTRKPMEGNTNLLYKDFLLPDDSLIIELTTFVYLPKKPTSDTEKKLYTQICENWVDSILSYEELKDHYDKTTETLVPFFWPLKSKLSKDGCDKMIEQYDYARANQLMRSHKLNTKKAQFVSLYRNVHVTMDVSSLTEDSDITKAFQVWSSYMTKVPEKNDSVYIFTIVDSLKKVLAALEHLVVAKTKG